MTRGLSHESLQQGGSQLDESLQLFWQFCHGSSHKLLFSLQLHCNRFPYNSPYIFKFMSPQTFPLSHKHFTKLKSLYQSLIPANSGISSFNILVLLSFFHLFLPYALMKISINGSWKQPTTPCLLTCLLDVRCLFAHIIVQISGVTE